MKTAVTVPDCNDCEVREDSVFSELPLMELNIIVTTQVVFL